MQNEDISQYVLYLACRYMEFIDIDAHEIAFAGDFEKRKIQAEEMARKIKLFAK